MDRNINISIDLMKNQLIKDCDKVIRGRKKNEIRIKSDELMKLRVNFGPLLNELGPGPSSKEKKRRKEMLKYIYDSNPGLDENKLRDNVKKLEYEIEELNKDYIRLEKEYNEVLSVINGYTKDNNLGALIDGYLDKGKGD